MAVVAVFGTQATNMCSSATISDFAAELVPSLEVAVMNLMQKLAFQRGKLDTLPLLLSPLTELIRAEPTLWQHLLNVVDQVSARQEGYLEKRLGD